MPGQGPHHYELVLIVVEEVDAEQILGIIAYTKMVVQGAVYQVSVRVAVASPKCVSPYRQKRTAGAT